ncbi:MAG: DivIVA domain-containing protein [Aquihabitans sp.]
MELTLKRLLEQAEFSRTKRGYAPEEVDDFLDRAVAMATKVEARLTQAMAQEKASPGPAGADPGEIEAEVSRRVEAALADQAAKAPPAPEVPHDDEAIDEVSRTLVLAQRTADAAVKEAREDAARLLADAEARVAAAKADLAKQMEGERSEAQRRLGEEIAALEGAREALRSDVGVLERHVEEQRNQLRSTVNELQRLLDDPAGFRLAPTPALLDPEIPELAEPEPEPEPTPEPRPEAEPQPEVKGGDLSFADVDHEPPPPPAGPPTQPVSAVDLDLDAKEGDPFLDELRKAMSDEEPLGPRDSDDHGEQGSSLFGDDDDDKRGWRFGKRR